MILSTRTKKFPPSIFSQPKKKFSYLPKKTQFFKLFLCLFGKISFPLEQRNSRHKYFFHPKNKFVMLTLKCFVVIAWKNWFFNPQKIFYTFKKKLIFYQKKKILLEISLCLLERTAFLPKEKLLMLTGGKSIFLIMWSPQTSFFCFSGETRSPKWKCFFRSTEKTIF